MLTFNLRGPEDTSRLGRAIAGLAGRLSLPPLLLQGGLGAGKTTLARALVEALPGGELAEVSSPSFTLCNIYPTRPESRHFDLYRLGQGDQDAGLRPARERPCELPYELFDALEEAEHGACIVLLEWPELLPQALLPPCRLLCRLTREENSRTACLEGSGREAAAFLGELEQINFETLRSQ